MRFFQHRAHVTHGLKPFCPHNISLSGLNWLCSVGNQDKTRVVIFTIYSSLSTLLPQFFSPCVIGCMNWFTTLVHTCKSEPQDSWKLSRGVGWPATPPVIMWHTTPVTVGTLRLTHSCFGACSRNSNGMNFHSCGFQIDFVCCYCLFAGCCFLSGTCSRTVRAPGSIF